MSTPDPIANSNLPADIQSLIRQVIKRSRLWKRERQSLTLELLAHFLDGLDAGQSADDLVKKFGDPKLAAKLMRRGKKRNRPMWWQACAWSVRGTCIFLVAYLVLAGLLSLRHPQVSVDYVAQMNRTIQTIPQDQCAWPIYRKAWIEADVWKNDSTEIYAKDKDGALSDTVLQPGDPDWPRAAAFLDKHANLLAALREGGAKPALGLTFHPQGEYSSEEDKRALFGPDRASKYSASPLVQQSAVAIHLRHLAPMLSMAKILKADMYRAASEQDSARVVADYRAILGVARQVRESGHIVSQRISFVIGNLANETILEVNAKYPTLLKDQRVALLHEMAANMPAPPCLTVEKNDMRDMIQRVYSDNGQGGGTITLDGLRLLNELKPLVSSGKTEWWWSYQDYAAQSLLLPAAVAITASRQETTEQAELFYSLAQEDIGRPLWEKLRSRSKSTDLAIKWRTSPVESMRYSLLIVMAPSINRVGEIADTTRALHETTMVVMSLEVYRDKQGNFPATLADLVPQYLPAIPVDHSTGGPLRYKLVEGKPLLYGLGKDGVDDGGVWSDKKTSYPKVPDTGDWVLFPPPENKN